MHECLQKTHVKQTQTHQPSFTYVCVKTPVQRFVHASVCVCGYNCERNVGDTMTIVCDRYAQVVATVTEKDTYIHQHKENMHTASFRSWNLIYDIVQVERVLGRACACMPM